MRLNEVINQLSQHQIQLSLTDDQTNLKVNAPKCAMTADLLSLIKDHKAELLAFIQQHQQQSIQARDPSARIPLSSSQRRLYMTSLLAPELATYHVPLALMIKGDLDVDALKQSLNFIIDRHESLRTFFIDGDQPAQQVASSCEVDLDYETSSISIQHTAALKEAALTRIKTPFDLTQAPLLRAHLLALNEPRHWLFIINLHHLITDGWSNGILLEEIKVAYQAFSHALTPNLPPIALQFGDFAVWEQQQAQGGIAYWQDTLNGLETLNLPFDHPRPAAKSGQGAEYHWQLTDRQSQGLAALTQAGEHSEFEVFLGVFMVFLHKLSQQDDIVVGAPTANRQSASLQNTVGFFVNTLALRQKIKGQQSIKKLLTSISELMKAVSQHETTPFDDIVDALAPNRDRSITPLFQVMMAYQPEVEMNATADLAITPFPLATGTAKFDLTFGIKNRADLSFEYDTDLLTAESIEAFADYFNQVLEQIIQDSDQAIDQIQLLDRAKAETVIALSQGAKLNLPFCSPLARFQTIVDQHKNKVALDFEGQQFTYQTLDLKSKQIASKLKEHGIQSHQKIVIALPRGIEMISSVIACLKLGCCYVPLDPSYPENRIQHILTDAKANALISLETFKDKINHLPVKTFTIESLISTTETTPVDAIDNFAWSPEAIVYMIYTSGSTGKPKGVPISAQGLMRLIEDEDAFGFKQHQSVLHLANVAFDASVWEIFGALLNGSTLYGFSEDTVLDLPEFAHRLSLQPINQALFPVSLFNLLVELYPAHLGRFSQIALGGEAPDIQKLIQFNQAHPHIALYNLYGPTENTVVTTYHRLQPDNFVKQRLPLGRPVAETACYILDKTLNLCPLGVSGQLAIASSGLTAGYHELKAINASQFIDNPFNQEKGFEKLYLSGDLAKMDRNGQLYFIGRNDDQIKLRGFRIEIQEIEKSIQTFEAIQDCAVIVAPEKQQLIAFVIAKTTTQQLPLALRQFLQPLLPHYMLPNQIIEIGAIPQTANGKIDKKALLAMATNHAKSIISAETPHQHAVINIFTDVLQPQDSISIDDDFFMLGGHSLLATRVVSQLRTELDLNLSLKALFDHPSVVDLAAHLDQLAANNDRASLTIKERPDQIPASFAQQRLWFIEQLSPGSLYHMPFAVAITGPLSIERFQQAFDQVIQRHESLRTVFKKEKETLYQVLIKANPELEHYPLQAEEDLSTLMTKRIETPFDLAQGPLVRATLYTRDETAYLVLCLHHIIADGWSIEVLIQDLWHFYQGTPLPALRYQYADYSLLEQQKLETTEAQAKDYFTEALQSASVLNLPTDFKRPKQLDHQGATYQFTFTPRLTQALKQLAQKESASLFMLTLSAWSILMGRYSQQQDVTVGSPVANRLEPNAEQAIGLFLNTLVFRQQFSLDQPFTDFLKQVKAATLHGFEYQYFPFDRLVELLSPKRDLSQTPLFQTMLILQTQAHQGQHLEGQFGDLSLTALAGTDRAQNAKFDLTLNLVDVDNKLSGVLEYRQGLFKASTIERMAEHFINLLTAIVTSPTKTIGQFDLLSENERYWLLQAPNGPNHTHVDYPKTSILSLFAQQVKQQSEQIAVIDEDNQISYQALDTLSDRLAHFIQTKTDKMVVGLMLDRSIQVSVALLAILKAGRCYVPIDPQTPQARIDYMLADCDCDLVLTDSISAAPFVNIHQLDLTESYSTLGTKHNPQSLWAVIYTSGSTGKPKGVMVKQAGILNRLQWMQAEFPLGIKDRVLQKTPLTFDVAIWELFWPLITGAQLVYAKKDGHKDPHYLANCIERFNISVLHFVPSMLQAFLPQALPQQLNSVKQVFTSGEALPQSVAEDVYTKFKQSQLANLYGPTEASIDVTYKRLSMPIEKVTLGKPIANTQIVILDESLHLCPVNVPGEIYLAGVQLAEGYLQRPDLTEAAFIDNPFRELNSKKLYKTGDLGRLLDNGEIDYLGRNDFQVKIRGQRIELGDIEQALLHIDGIQAAMVVQQDDQLAAYIIGENQDFALIKTYLAKQLPQYMLPTLWQTLDALPLNNNGKIDRKKLTPITASTRHFIDAETTLQKQLVDCFKTVLSPQFDQQPLSIDADFFLIGGHSLKAISLTALIEEKLKITLRVDHIFLYPSVMALSEFIAKGTVQSLPAIIQRKDANPIPASENQRQMWLMQQMMPQSNAYHLPILLTIAGSIDTNEWHKAFAQLITQHEILRTTLKQKEQTLVQLIHDASNQALTVTLKANDLDEAISMAKQANQQVFDLQQDTPLRYGFITYSANNEQHTLVYIILHHVAGDATTLGILFNDLLNLLTQKQPLVSKRLQYADFAYWQHENQRVIKKQLDFWQQQLANLVAQPVLSVIKQPRMQANQHASFSIELNAEQKKPLLALSENYQLTPFMALLGSLQFMLAKLSEINDICVGVPVSGRHRAGLTDVAGYFVNTLLVRQKINPTQNVQAYFKEVKTNVLSALAHQDVSIQSLVEHLSLTEMPSQIGFNYFTESQQLNELTFEGKAIDVIQQADQTAKFEAIFSVLAQADHFHLTVDYDQGLFKAEDIKDLVNYWLDTIHSLAQLKPTASLSEISRFNRSNWQQARSLIAAADRYQSLHPLLPMQAAMKLDDEQSGITTRNTLGWLQQIATPFKALDINRLKDALIKTKVMHPGLRLEWVSVDQGLMKGHYQALVKADLLAEQSDIHCHHFDNKAALTQFAQNTVYRAYDDQTPLFQVQCLVLNLQSVYLLVSAHHACIDGIGLEVATQTLSDCYSDPNLSIKPSHYLDYLSKATVSSESESFWQQQMQGVLPLQPMQGVREPQIKHERLLDDAAHFTAIKAFCQQHKTTPALYLKALYGLLLSSYSLAEDDFFIEEVLAQRQAKQRHEAGCFFTLLPVRFAIDTLNNGDFLTLLKQLRLQQKQSKPYRDISRTSLNSLLPQGDCAYLFNFYTLPDAIHFDGKPAPLNFIEPILPNTVNLRIQIVQDQLQLLLSYEHALFNSEHFLSRLVSLSHQILNGQQQLNSLTILQDDEPTAEVNCRSNFPAKNMAEWLHISMAPFTHQIAVTDANGAISYQQLKTQSDDLAQYLIAQQYDHQCIGVALQPGCELMVALLAIIKAAGHYVYLDPSQPEARLQFIIEDAQVAVIISEESLPTTQPIVSPKAKTNVLLSWPSSKDSAPFYTIYTSGSTGNPKGLSVSHSNVINLLTWYQQCFEINPTDNFLIFSGLGFDLTQKNLWVSLLSGAKLCFAEQIHFDPIALADQIKQQQITLINAAPSACYPLLKSANAIEKMASLRWLLLGGEPIKINEMQPWFSTTKTQVVNMYGPSECTDITTWYKIPKSTQAQVPLGKLADFVTLFTVDTAGRQLPKTLVGELTIAGSAVGLGYVGEASTSSESFVNDALLGKTYRTGDLGYQAQDGLWYYQGRKDHQIKVRGIRIEPQEIEQAFRQLDTVTDALVLLDKKDRLVAYLITEKATLPSWRNQLAKIIPQRLIPQAIGLLKAFPLNANGKVDRKQLPEITHTSALKPAQTMTEKQVLAVFQQAFKQTQLGINDRFFSLGGHSLIAAEIVSSLNQQFEINLTIVDFLAAEDIEAVAKCIDQQDKTQQWVLKKAPVMNHYPLSIQQERLWLLEQIQTPSSMYHIPQVFALKGNVNSQKLAQAVQSLIKCHPILATSIQMEAGELSQSIKLERPYFFAVNAKQSITLEEQILNEIQTPFSLDQGPLFKVVLLTENTSCHHLIIVMHHIISDGLSMPILFDDLIKAYQSLLSVDATQLNYFDYAYYQRTSDAATEGDFQHRLTEASSYWQNYLKDVPLMNLPGNQSYPQQANVNGAVYTQSLPDTLHQKVKVLCSQQSLTPASFFMASFQLLLSRYCQQQDIVVGTAVANRPIQALNNLIGFFVNTVVIRSQVNEDQTASAWLNQVQHHFKQALLHQALPFEQLIEQLDIPRALGHSPIFQAFLSYQQSTVQAESSLEELELKPVIPKANLAIAAKFELSLHLLEQIDDEHLAFSFEYRTQLFKPGLIEQMAEHFIEIVEQLLSLAQPLKTLGFNKALSVVQQKAIETNDFLPVIKQQQGSQPALICGQSHYHYDEMHQAANSLAATLKELGIMPQQRVALCIENGAEFTIAVLAIIHLGGIYVPLDTRLPTKRIAQIIDDADCALIITDQELETDHPLLLLADVDRAEQTVLPAYRYQPSDSLYLIYTSGSTGKPKGVEVLYAAECRLLSWYTESLKAPSAKHLIISAKGFDLTQKNLFAPLMTKGTLHFVDAAFDPKQISDYIEQAEIAVINCAPAAFMALLALTESNDYFALRSLKRVLLGGEALEGDKLKHFMHTFPHCQCINMYGPTEATDISTTHQIKLNELNQPIPLGRAINGVNLYVLDSDQQPVALGVVGELYLGGAQLAKGYWQRTTLTEQAFIQHEKYGRLYRTQDLVSMRDDSSLLFHGRNDHQVKVRGHRIELSEIDHVLLALDSVQAAVTIQSAESLGLISYVVTEAETDTASIRQKLNQLLPHYMVPSVIHPLSALPYNTNGKIDRNALPAINITQTVNKVPPTNPIEMRLMAIWQHILAQPVESITDDFFLLGGHSLKAAQLQVRIRQVFQLDIGLNQLFTYSTLAQQAVLISEKQQLTATIPKLDKAPPQAKKVLSYSQQRLWLLTQMANTQTAYHMPGSFEVKGKINTQALAQAVKSLVARQESLRTGFILEQGEPTLRIIDIDQSPIALASIPLQDKNNLNEVISSFHQRPFDLTSCALFRIALVSTNEDQHWLLLNLHHLIGDAQSIRILLTELIHLYQSHDQHQPIALAPPQVQYSDFALWQRNWLKDDVLADELSFWQSNLADITPLLPLPTDYPRPEVQQFRGQELSYSLSNELQQSIRIEAQTHQVTPFSLMLSAFHLLLNQFSQHDDIAVGVPVAGRDVAGVESLIGFFINAVIVRHRFNHNDSLKTLIKTIHQQSLSAMAHAHVPIEMLLNTLSIERSLAYTPVVQCAFNLITEDQTSAHLANEDFTITAMQTDNPVAKFDLQMNVLVQPDAMHLSIEFNRDLFTTETISSLLDRYTSLLNLICTAPDRRLNTIDLSTLIEQSDYIPLTTLQQSIYLAQKTRPLSNENSLGYALHLPINLHVEHFKNAVLTIHDQCSALNARIVEPKVPFSQLAYFKIDQTSAAFTIHDLSKVPLSKEQMDEKLSATVTAAYDLAGSLVRYDLFKLSDHHYWFTFGCHHLVADAFSGVIHLRQLFSLYESAIENRKTEIFIADTFKDHAQKHNALFDQVETVSYWQEQLKNCTGLAFIQPNQPQKTGTQLLSLELDGAHLKQIKQFCKRNKITPALYFKGLYALLIRYYCQHDQDFVITEFNGGRDKTNQHSLGCYYFPQPFCLHESALSGRVDDLFKDLKTTQKSHKPYLHISQQALKALLPESELGFSFNYLMLPHHYEMLGQSFTGHRYTPNAHSMVDFRVQVDDRATVLWLAFHHDRFNDLRFLERLVALSKQCIDGVEATHSLNYFLADEPILQPKKPTVIKRSVYEQFVETALKHPEKTVLIDDKNHWRFSTFQQAVADFSHQLTQQGFKPNDRALIALTESVDLAVAVFSVMALGGCYIPLDLSYPEARKAFILEDAQANWFIAESAPDHALLKAKWISPNSNKAQIETDANPTELPKVNPHLDDPFYMLYTSGTTGKPKGAMVSNQNEANLISWYKNEFNISTSDTLMLVSSIGFDLSQKNLLVPFCSGAKLVLTQLNPFDPDHLLGKINQHKVNIINCAPSTLYGLIERGVEPLVHNLRLILLGGEAIDWLLLKPLVAHPDFTADIVNMYGPTECTDITTSTTFKAKSLKQRFAAQQWPGTYLGQTIDGVSVNIVNQQQQPLINGLIGEIAISGTSLGLGYWQRPSLNQQVFIEAEPPYYLTGDYAYRDEHQQLHYYGRKDHQIKRRGRRIELLEIQQALQTFDQVQQAKVLLTENRLVAFVTCSESAQDYLYQNWKTALSKVLPNFMVPQQLICLEQMPLNAHGKIDQHKLAQLNKGARDIKLAQTDTEKALQQIWQGVLGKTLSIEENFFEVGGDSLSAVKLMTKIELHFAIELPIASLFNAQTIQDQAQLIEALNQPFSPIVAINPAPKTSSQQQQPVFAIHALGGMVLSYQPLAKALGEKIPFYGVQAYGFEKEQSPFTDWDDLIDYYYQAIKKTQSGPYKLIGHSFGGLIALAIAVKMQESGDSVAYLGLIDTHPPTWYHKLPVDDAYLLKTFIEHNFGEVDIPLSGLRVLAKDVMYKKVSESLQGAVSPEFLMRATAVIRGFQTMMKGYELPRIDVPITLYRAKEQQGINKLLSKFKKDDSLGFNQVADCEVKWLNGNHFSLLHDQKNEIAKALIEQNRDD